MTTEKKQPAPVLVAVFPGEEPARAAVAAPRAPSTARRASLRGSTSWGRERPGVGGRNP